MQDLIQDDEIITAIVFNLIPEQTELTTQALYLLISVCWEPQGNQLILQALENLMVQRRHKSRFEILLDGLKTDNTEVQLQFMSLTNGIIESFADPITRQNLRAEFISNGILDAMKTIQVKFSHINHRKTTALDAIKEEKEEKLVSNLFGEDVAVARRRAATQTGPPKPVKATIKVIKHEEDTVKEQILKLDDINIQSLLA